MDRKRKITIIKEILTGNNCQALFKDRPEMIFDLIKEPAESYRLTSNGQKFTLAEINTLSDEYKQLNHLPDWMETRTYEDKLITTYGMPMNVRTDYCHINADGKPQKIILHELNANPKYLPLKV